MWRLFEEPISSDYVTDAGELVLELTANKANTTFSNHVSAQDRLNDTGADGTFTYSARAMILANPSDNLTFPETGPEISVQNTREVAGPNFLTCTMGVQYVANPWGPPNWRAWKEVSPGVGQWVFMSSDLVLVPNRWYSLKLTADMQAKTYKGFTVTDEVTNIIYDFQLLIDGQPIASEDKWEEAALWATLETENLYQSNRETALPLQGRMRYADVNLVIEPPEE